MSAFTVTVRAGPPVLRRAPVHLGVADPVPRALLGRLRDDVQVLLDRGTVGDRDVEGHDHRHPDPHGLAGERRDGRVGLLVEGQPRGGEPGGPLDRRAAVDGRLAGHGVRRGRLEQRARGPGLPVRRQLPGDRAGLGADRDGGERAGVGRHREASVDRDGGGATLDVGMHDRLGHLGLRTLRVQDVLDAVRVAVGLRVTGAAPRGDQGHGHQGADDHRHAGAGDGHQTPRR